MRESKYNVWARTPDAHCVFNGVSGEVVALSPEERNAFEDWLAGSVQTGAVAPTLERLVRARALINDHTDELDMLRRRFERSSSDSSHLGLTIVTSMGCNFDCPYCFESKEPALLQDNVADAIVQLVDDRLTALADLSVMWYGGEPLLGTAPLLRLARRLMDQCRDAGVRYSSVVVTNGWLLDGSTAAELAAHGVGQAQVTLDGPPEIHDRMRPHSSGGPTFERIVMNLVEAVDRIPIVVRVNIDGGNVGGLEPLLGLLRDAGLAGRVSLGLGHLAAVSHNSAAPSASYTGPCLSRRDFGGVEIAFGELATHYGFTTPALPPPRGTPCTAVHRNELIVGARGEIWKCLDDAGNSSEQIGTIFDRSDPEHRLKKWLSYDPFTDEECASCVALPVCMGGCTLYARTPELHDNRCSTFRTHHVERVTAAVNLAGRGLDDVRAALARGGSTVLETTAQGTPVVLSARPPRSNTLERQEP